MSLNQRIFLVTGKGGVGKSAVAMAVARQLAKKGQRTLLAELGEYSYFEFALGVRGVYEPVQIEENLEFSLWNGESCLREYVRHLVPVRKIADLFFDNKVMRAFVGAAPGLKELAILGKLTSGVRSWGPKFDYENVVVDAYSSGHFLALLRAPKGMGELIESGPMGEQSRSIFAALRDPRITTYVLVCTPEELPVAETIEVNAALKELMGCTPEIYLNRFYEFKDKDLAGVDFPLADYIRRLDERSSASREALLKVSSNLKTIELIRESGARKVIETMIAKLEAPV